MKNEITDVLSSIRDPLKLIGSCCKKNKLTIAVAESVTAGCLQLFLSNAERAGEFFQGGITAYNCSQKSTHLFVEPIFAENCDGVDASIAAQMAKEVCRLFRSQIGVGITGYATKVPEEGVTDLFAFLNIVINDEVVYKGKLEATEEGLPAQLAYAKQVILRLADQLTDEVT